MKKGAMFIVFLAGFFNAVAQIGFTPSPVVRDNSVIEKQLFATWKSQLKSVEYLKGKQASEVKKSFESRYELMSEMLANGEFIFDSPVLTYCRGVF